MEPADPLVVDPPLPAVVDAVALVEAPVPVVVVPTVPLPLDPVDVDDDVALAVPVVGPELEVLCPVVELVELRPGGDV